MEGQLKRTPLYGNHLKLGARFVPFAGFEMPVQYTSVVEEHMAVRKRAGIFDVSHMAPMRLRGPGVLKMLQYLTCNNVDVEQGRAKYTPVMNEQGGVRDDIILYRESSDSFFTVVNASNAEKIRDYFKEHLGEADALDFLRGEICIISIQGPEARKIAAQVLGDDVLEIKRWHFGSAYWEGEKFYIARTGYTGEDGLEMFPHREFAGKLWDRLIDVGKEYGCIPCGLGARDSLRLEKGYPLYGHELREEWSPVVSSLERFIDMGKNFAGKFRIEKELERGTERKIKGILMEEGGIPREGYRVITLKGEGFVTSGTYSPVLRRGIALALLPSEVEEGEEVKLEVRGKFRRARVKTPPFV